MLKDVFGFAEHQEKATYGLGYKLTLTRISYNAVLNKDNATKIGKIKVNSIEWYVSHFTASILQQSILSKQILSKVPTASICREVCFHGRSKYSKLSDF